MVEWSAARISDPVWRLRYLQAVAPRPHAFTRVKRFPAIVAMLLSVIGCGAIVAFRHKPVILRAFASGPAAPVTHPVEVRETPRDVWLVEKTAAFESYSNGLRIENQYLAEGTPRSFMAYPLRALGSQAERRTAPVGIVYHTTESLLAPFESSQNTVLKRVGESLLEYVRRRRCYHFLIDRFGRVFRIVEEGSPAGHAGNSIWADAEYAYVNLNDSFLGISFEAQTGAGESATAVEAHQVRAAATLTEMLRRRYGILAGNCVTHAQVSVNPDNMRIGYHLDWASSFPFDRVGLPDNYAIPSPAIRLFGFTFDADFQQRAGARMSGNAAEAEEQVAQQAGAAHLAPELYRKSLRKLYHRIFQTGESQAAAGDGTAP